MEDRVCQDDCEAYRLFGTPDELELEAMQYDANFMSPGLTAWRAIAFALERGVDLPHWVRRYLSETGKALDDWAACNGHPSELKGILHLYGRRIEPDVVHDPRRIYEAICQMREQKPKASIKNLVEDYMERFPKVRDGYEYVRQKYYQGKKLAEKGQDYKGRDRKTELLFHPYIEPDYKEYEIDF